MCVCTCFGPLDFEILANLKFGRHLGARATSRARALRRDFFERAQNISSEDDGGADASLPGLA
eukprot:82801-Pyramimonas_sp.AAC.1